MTVNLPQDGRATISNTAALDLITTFTALACDSERAGERMNACMREFMLRRDEDSAKAFNTAAAQLALHTGGAALEADHTGMYVSVQLDSFTGFELTLTATGADLTWDYSPLFGRIDGNADQISAMLLALSEHVPAEAVVDRIEESLALQRPCCMAGTC